MDNKSIASNLRVLEKDYEDAYQSRGGLDERMFINGDDSLLGTSSSGSPRFSGSKVICSECSLCVCEWFCFFPSSDEVFYLLNTLYTC